MKKSPVILILIMLSLAAVFAQIEELPVEKARLVDEFGWINCDEYLARTDAVMAEQANNPGAITYVIVYEGMEKLPVYKKNELTFRTIFPPKGLAKAKIASMKKRLSIRRMALENFVFVEGGLREDFKVEFWLVPPGAEAPKPAPTLDKMKYRKGKAQGFCLDCCDP